MLELFPQTLAYSIIASVYLGFLLTFLASESFGWPPTGLVVPGYLAPILIIQPVSGAIVVVEGVLTYLLVRLVSGGMSRLGLWARFFGRDRFFAILLGSILVRIGFEGLLLHRYGPRLAVWLDLAPEAVGSFYGIGFVASALLANSLWKPGIKRGLGGMGLLVGATYLAVRFLLIPLSNFSVVRLDLIYEDLAINFMASPRAYIFLLLGAALSSRLSRIYGFGAGGILVAPLLALTVTAPIKLLVTLVEALAVVWLGRLVLRLPMLAGRSIEGTRRLLLAFTLAFGLRFAEGWLLQALNVTGLANDFTAFGYMLSSLIAAQIWNREYAGLVLRPVLQTVAGTFVLGTAATLLMPMVRQQFEAPLAGAPPAPAAGRAGWSEALLAAREPGLRKLRRSQEPPLPDELARLRAGLTELLEWTGGEPPVRARRALAQLESIGYRVWRLEEDGTGIQLLAAPDLSAGRSARMWGAYFLAPRSPSTVALEVARPDGGELVLDAALALHRRLGTRVLAVAPPRSAAGGPLRWGGGESPRPLATVLAAAGITLRVEVAAAGSGSASALEGPGPAIQPLAHTDPGSISAGLAGLLVASASRGAPLRCRLLLAAEDRERLVGLAVPESIDAPAGAALADWLAGGTAGAPAPAPGTWPEEASELHLRYAREYVFQPLAAALAEAPRPLAEADLARIAYHAGQVGLAARLAGPPGAPTGLLLLPQGAGAGLALVLPDVDATPLLLELPRRTDDSELAAAAAELAARLRPRVLLAAAAGADLSRPESEASLFQLAHQELALALGAEGLTLQLRPGPEPLTPVDPRTVVTWGLSPDGTAAERVLATLAELDWRPLAAESRPDTAGLTGPSPQKELGRFLGLPYAALYLPPALRHLYGDALAPQLAGFDLAALGLAIEEGPLERALGPAAARTGLAELPPAFDPLTEPLAAFLASGQAGALEPVAAAAAGAGLDLRLVRDGPHGGLILVAAGRAAVLAVRAGLAGRLPPAPQADAAASALLQPASDLATFRARRATSLVLPAAGPAAVLSGPSPAAVLSGPGPAEVSPEGGGS